MTLYNQKTAFVFPNAITISTADKKVGEERARRGIVGGNERERKRETEGVGGREGRREREKLRREREREKLGREGGWGREKGTIQ